ncbi:hypothetical protein BLNAU_4714 [Blattamonas nauphoetae]|uniref:Uncharacterized protein n=1 Tax=Blattamonas nauphoetae TaxID=2049346 RepID=A0ABQ9Y8R4_9EUKA|nr:hypothetical protein BLNAU_4714 [Blattamonas nauphoetae]
MLDSLILFCSIKVRLALVKANLIPQLVITLNLRSLSLTDYEHIHTDFVKIIRSTVWIATPDCLAELGIEDHDEQQALRELVLKQVLTPTEQYIRHLCVNRYSIVDVRLDPFVRSISHYNDLLLLARTYSNMTLMSEDSVLRQQNQLLPDSVAESSLILRSQFSFVSDGIDITIVRLFCHTASFLAQNTTFSNGLEWGKLVSIVHHLPGIIDLTLKDCTFLSSKSDHNDGTVAEILDGSINEECRLTVDIEHCIFSNTATRTGEGGGVFINVQGDTKYSGSTVIRAKSEFNDSSSTIGGCICSPRSTTQCHSLMLDDSFVESSHAEMDGTIAHEVSLSSTSSFSATFISTYNCSSSLGGSFVFVIHKYLSISVTSSTFTRSTSTACGGCITINQNNSASHFHCAMLVNSANREMGLNYNLISGLLGLDNFVECTEVPPQQDQGTVRVVWGHINGIFLMSVADKTGQHTFSINSETREIFANEESGHDSNMCGFKLDPCSSIHFSARVSSRSAFSISAVGNFTAPEHPVILASPCMRLTSGPSAEETRACLNFSLYAVPILQAPNNPFELSHLIFILETDQNDGAFFRVGQSSTHIRDILMFYPGQLHISLFFLPHTSTSKFMIDLDAHALPLNNIALFSSDSTVSLIDSSTFETLVFSGSSTFLGLSKNTTVRSSSFANLRSTEPFFRLSFSTLHLHSSQFQFCQVESDALVVVDEGSVVNITSSSFKFCRWREAGVVLFTDKADTLNPFTGVDLISNRYTHKEGIGHAMTSRFGNDIPIRNKALLLAITNCRSSSIFPRVVVGDSEHAEAIDLFAPKQSVFHLDISGTDSHKCGMKTLPCCTLQYTIGITNETNKKDEMTTIRPYGPFSDVSVLIGRKSVVLHGQGLTEFEAPDSPDGLMLKIDDSSVVLRQIVFRITSSDCGSFVSSTESNIEMDDCTVSVFIPSPAISSHASSLQSLFSINSGTFVVSQLRSDDFHSTMLSSTLFSLNRTNFRLDNSTLSSLSTDSESGLMCGTVQHTHFDLDKVMFEDLNTASNCGILNLTVIDNGSVSLTETTFSHLTITSPLISLTLSSSPSMTTQTSIVVDVSTLHVWLCRGTGLTGAVLLVDNPHNIQWTLTESEYRVDLNEIEWDSFGENKRSRRNPKNNSPAHDAARGCSQMEDKSRGNTRN